MSGTNFAELNGEDEIEFEVIPAKGRTGSRRALGDPGAGARAWGAGDGALRRAFRRAG
jgi:hypothetical protein